MKNRKFIGSTEFVLIFGVISIVDAVVSGQFAAGLGYNFPFLGLVVVTSIVAAFLIIFGFVE